MVRKYFRTDGIRGRANGVITPELALKVGHASGLVFRRGDHRHRVVIGKDTRLSGYMIETALIAGFTSVGMDVLQLGPMPTPAVAMLTRSMRADLGVKISASHNPFDDNGIKLFGPDGYKLSDGVEQEIEALIDANMTKRLAKSRELGRAKRIDGVKDRYIEFAKRTLPRNLSLEGLRVVIDCAHGAAYRVAPEALWELGAEVVAIGVEPDGFNINRECGSTDPGALCRKVREVRADIGIALDGDADRVVNADEQGHLIDGDQLLAAIAESWREDGRLAKPGVVAAVMSNLGVSPLRRPAAGVQERALSQRQAAGELKSALGDRGRRAAPQWSRPAGGAAVGHRAGDPHHGRGRRQGAGRGNRRRHCRHTDRYRGVNFPFGIPGARAAGPTVDAIPSASASADSVAARRGDRPPACGGRTAPAPSRSSTPRDTGARSPIESVSSAYTPRGESRFS
jgi:phosphoglucosamine mutase